jgi:squalene-associated FAD-dependent desaturase
MKRVAVIGAGWAGLACAMELAAAGRAVTVFEAARQAGGRARRVDWHGLALDNGQHLMIGAYRETLRLLERLGTAELVERRPLELRLPGFRLRLPRLPAPLHLAAGLAAAHGLGWREKRAAIGLMQRLKGRGFRLSRDTTVAAFLAEHGQPPGLVARLWEPICVAALNTPIQSASAQVFCNVLRDSLMGRRADSDFLFARGDLGRLFVDPALAFIHDHGGSVRLGSRVEAVAPRPDGRQGGVIDGEAYDAVVWAGHPAQLDRFGAPFADAGRPAAGYAWQPILTTWLRFAAPVGFPYPMLGLGPGQAPWAFDRSDLAPGLVALVVSAEGPHLQIPEDERNATYLAALADCLGPLPPLLDRLTIVEKRATFSCVPDLPRPANRLAPGLYLAGDYSEGPYPATLEGAVRSGVKCAQLILEQP